MSLHHALIGCNAIFWSSYGNQVWPSVRIQSDSLLLYSGEYRENEELLYQNAFG